MANRNPVLLFVYEDEVAGHNVFIARSLTTGHIAMSTTREHALHCVVTTIHLNMKFAVEERGLSRKEWFEAQRLDDEAYAARWIEAAKMSGLEQVRLPESTRTALVNAA